MYAHCYNPRSVTQLNMKLTQEITTYNDEITTLSDTHSKEVNNLKVGYNERMKDLQQTIFQLNQKVWVIQKILIQAKIWGYHIAGRFVSF